MKKIFLPFLLFTAFCFFSCSRDETIVKIQRTPELTFNFNGASWKADTYGFASISKVVVYPQDTSQPGQLLNRLTLQATGRDSLKNTYQFIVTFDVIDVTNLVGAYTPAYTPQRGLAQVQLFNLTNSSDLSAYELCDNDLANAMMQIEKQKPDERIITGNFHMTLCNARDTTQKIIITNGVIKDIKY